MRRLRRLRHLQGRRKAFETATRDRMVVLLPAPCRDYPRDVIRPHHPIMIRAMGGGSVSGQIGQLSGRPSRWSMAMPKAIETLLLPPRAARAPGGGADLVSGIMRALSSSRRVSRSEAAAAPGAERTLEFARRGFACRISHPQLLSASSAHPASDDDANELIALIRRADRLAACAGHRRSLAAQPKRTGLALAMA